MYELEATAVDNPADHLKLRAHTTSLVVSGLNAGTRYKFVVAAKNGVGRSSWSEPAVAVTRSATDRPSAPQEAPEIMPSSACDVVNVRVPQLDRGCSGETTIVLEVAEAQQAAVWHEVDASSSTATQLRASGLSPGKPYRFRLRQRNSLGMSEPGPMTKATLSGGMQLFLRRAPHVEALSSSSYRVTWVDTATMPCKIQLAWRVEYRRATDGVHEWQTIVDRSTETHLELKLRCPTGCSFRVTAINLAGWSEPSIATEPIATHQLHPPVQGAVRLELLLLHPDTRSSADMLRRFEHTIAEALTVNPSRVHGVEMREASSAERAAVFDLLPASHSHLTNAVVQPEKIRGGLWAEADADTLHMAQQLAIHLLSADSVIRTRFDVDMETGLLQLSEDGSITGVGAWVPPPAAPPSPPELISGFSLTRLLFLASFVLCFYCCCCTHSKAPNGAKRYSKPAPTGSDDPATRRSLLEEAPPSPDEVFDDCAHLGGGDAESEDSTRLKAALHDSTSQELPSPRLEAVASLPSIPPMSQGTALDRETGSLCGLPPLLPAVREPIPVLPPPTSAPDQSTETTHQRCSQPRLQPPSHTMPTPPKGLDEDKALFDISDTTRPPRQCSSVAASVEETVEAALQAAMARKSQVRSVPSVDANAIEGEDDESDEHDEDEMDYRSLRATAKASRPTI